MGPLLLFRGCADGLWRLSATLSSMDAPPALRTDSGGASEPVLLLDEADIRIWRYDFALEMRAVERSETYHIGDRSWPVAVPAAGGHLRVAFPACHGDEKFGTASCRERVCQYV